MFPSERRSPNLACGARAGREAACSFALWAEILGSLRLLGGAAPFPEGGRLERPANAGVAPVPGSVTSAPCPRPGTAGPGPEPDAELVVG